MFEVAKQAQKAIAVASCSTCEHSHEKACQECPHSPENSLWWTEQTEKKNISSGEDVLV